MSVRIVLAWMFVLMLPLAAHSRHRAAPDPKAEARIHRVEKVAENVYCIFGQGGNIGLVVTERHAVLIDDQFERLAPGLLAAVKSVTDKPLKYLINTHFHGDHTGANLVLEKQVMAIVAHTNVRTRMKQAQAKLETSQQGGLPELALGESDPKVKARLNIYLDGTEMHLAHFGPGHTDGDLLVGIPSSLVIHMGDTVFMGMLPFIDLEGGGSFDGLVAQIAQMVSWLPEAVRVIPGHGPVCGKKELLRYLEFLKAVQAHAKAHPERSPKALAESFDTASWEKEWKPNPAFVTWETLFEAATGRGPGRVTAPTKP